MASRAALTVVSGPASSSNEDDLRDFLRQLQAESKSPDTLRTYRDSVRKLAACYPGRALLSLAKPDIQNALIRLSAAHKPVSVATYFRGWGRFFRWAVAEDLITSSPLDGLHPPAVPDEPLPIPGRAGLSALLALVDKDRTFEGLRDAAVIRTWCEAGCPRRAEMAALDVGDVDLDASPPLITIRHGKGGKFRVFPIGPKTARAWSRYLRARKAHPYAARSDRAVLGLAGSMGGGGLYKMLARRCTQAGIPHIHPHAMRHQATDAYLAAGGREQDIMTLNGWKDRSMLQRYGAAHAARRATAASAALAIGDAL